MRTVNLVFHAAAVVVLTFLCSCDLIGNGSPTGASNGDGSGNPALAPQGCVKYIGATAAIRDTVISSGSAGQSVDTLDLDAAWADARSKIPDIIGPYTLNAVEVLLDTLEPSGCAGKKVSGTIRYAVLVNGIATGDSGLLMTLNTIDLCTYYKTWIDPRSESGAVLDPLAVSAITGRVQAVAGGAPDVKIIVKSDLSLVSGGALFAYTRLDVIVRLAINGFECLD